METIHQEKSQQKLKVAGVVNSVRATDLGLTAALARFAIGTRFEDLPEDIVHATERIILDTIACTIAAADTAPGRSVAAFKRAQGGASQSTVAATGDRLSAAGATYVNAQLANVLDADETLNNYAHFASTIVMPALAVGEMVGATGADIVAAVAVGFDVASRVGGSLPNNDLAPDGTIVLAANRGFSWAAFGSATAAGRLIGLDESQVAQAFGIVTATAPVHGCLESFGAKMIQWHKYAMYGAVAEGGLNAALLAQEGFEADPTVLDRDSTSYRSFGASRWEPEVLVKNLGRYWYIADTSLKLYPFCRYAAGAIDAFSLIVTENGLEAGDIDDVLVTVPPFAFLQFIVDMPMPRQSFEIMVSLRYAYSLIASGVPAGPAWWDDDVLADPARQAFAGKVRSAVNDDWRSLMVDQISNEGYFRRVPITVEVAATGGRRFSVTSEYAKGDPWSPDAAMTDDELRDKVRNFTSPQLGEAGAEQLAEAGLNLASAPDLSAFLSAMVRH